MSKASIRKSSKGRTKTKGSARPPMTTEDLKGIASRHGCDEAGANEFARDIETVAAAFSRHPPEWVDQVDRVEPKVQAIFPAEVEHKKRWERARDGLGVLLKMLADLPQAEREALERGAFDAAGKAFDDRGSGAALQAVLETVLASVRAAIASSELSTSDHDLQQRGRLGGFAAACRKFGIPIGTGENSPLVKICESFGVGRTFVRTHLPKVLENIDQHVVDALGKSPASEGSRDTHRN